MSYLGSWAIDDNLTFVVNTHDPTTGAATDADAVPAYRVYEDETAAAILTGNMALLDAANTDGFYSEQIALTAANGFEVGKCYNIYISAAVGAVTGSVSHSFQMLAEVNDSTLETDLADILSRVTISQVTLTPLGSTTTGNGNVGGTTVVDTNRVEANDYWNGLSITPTSGAAAGQVRTIVDFVSGTGFTVSPPFSVQIVTGVTYRIISALVYQPGISVIKNHDTIVEPDTTVTLGISIITNNGVPLLADITAGLINIWRIRSGAVVQIVTDAAASKIDGNIYYSYAFPSASWAAGDNYLTTLSGVQVVVNGITYPLSTVSFRGYVTREASLLANLAVVDTNVDAILVDTGTTLDAALAVVDANVDAILADTGTDGVLLANDAITAAKIATDAITSSELAASAVQEIADQVWDEILAGHLGVGTTGTALNGAGTAGDPWIATLPGAYAVDSAGYIVGTFIDQAISAGLTAAQVWSYLSRTLTQSAASVVSAVSGSDITVPRLTTWSISLTGLGDISSRTKLYFTVKDDFGDTDATALFQVEETAGLLYLDGAAAGDSTDGTLTVDDAALGNITITSTTDATSGAADTYVYDVKMVTASTVTQLTSGKFRITSVVTRTVT